MKFEGRVWIFEDDDINTDLIFPGKYTYEPLKSEEMAKYAMEDYNPDFAKQVKKGDIIVAGKNFGCGSSREQAVTCLKYAGVSAIVAKSYARLFYRNAINSAIPAIKCPEAAETVFQKKPMKISIDLAQGKIFVEGQEFFFLPLDKQAILIFEAGGLVEYTKNRLIREGG
ncbi:MAG: 3-isopropylmalate dehydratase [Candidatus Stahlbacteria bacterium]|nr:3-isopropylmalate dehydratase [Candidatus Stahlbacteria bacterium]